MGKRSASVAFAAVAAAAAGVASARLIDEVSFDLLGNTGRSPSETMSGWQLTGDAVLIDTFVRLTPDEQHKRGGMSARHGMPPESGGADDDGWTADVTLRIHGVGASLAGDGVAVWLTQAPVQPGPLFGGESRFRGLLLGLDTYVNSVDAGAHPHPYVGIAINDGSELVTQDAAGLTTTAHGPAGCSVTQARQVGAHESRVITLRARYVRSARSLKLAYTYGAGPQDYRHRADTEWVSCASVSDVDIPQGFHWGATAATGAVSDNHDVLSLRVYRGAADAALAGAPSALPRPEDAYVFQPHAPAVDAAAAAAQQAPPPSQDQQQQAQQPPAPQIVRPTLERECCEDRGGGAPAVGRSGGLRRRGEFAHCGSQSLAHLHLTLPFLLLTHAAAAQRWTRACGGRTS